ncbi:MAG: extracellular solute-binding protein [Clostridiales bacterium]
MEIFIIKFKFIFLRRIKIFMKLLFILSVILIFNVQQNKIDSRIPINKYEKKKTLVIQVNNYYMSVNGIKTKVDNNSKVVPVIREGEVYIPIKSIIEKLGGNIFWIKDEEKALIVLDNDTIELWIDDNDILINGLYKEMKNTPYIENNRIYIPLKVLTENIECNIKWDAKSKKIKLDFEETDKKNVLRFWHYNKELVEYIKTSYMIANPDTKIIGSHIPKSNYYDIIKQIQESQKLNFPDVICTDLYDLKKMIRLNIFENLDKYNIDEIKKNKYKFSLDLAKNQDGKIYALNDFINPVGLVYKKDLALKYLGTDDNSKISNFFYNRDSIINMADLISKNSNGKVKMFASTYELYQMFLAKRDLPWNNSDEIKFDDDLYKNFELLKDLTINGDIDNIKYSSLKWDKTFKRDNHIFYYIPLWQIYSKIILDEKNINSNWDIAKDIEYSLDGGFWYGVSIKSKNKEEAIKFIKYISSNYSYLKENALVNGEIPNSKVLIKELESENYKENSGINVYENIDESINKLNGEIFGELDHEIDIYDNLKKYIKNEISLEQIIKKHLK